MSGPSLRHRLELAAFRVLRGAVRILPERLALGAGEVLGWLAGRWLRLRRDVVEANLALAFPERSGAERRRLALGSYRHLGREAVALLRLFDAPADEIRARTDVTGARVLDEVLARGRGAILVSGHLGNWEMGGAALAARGVPVDAVAFRQANRLFDAELVGARNRLGMRVFKRTRATSAVLRSLGEGRVPALVADQNDRGGRLFVDFFGVPAATARGAAVFALRTDTPVLVGTAVRLPGPRARYAVHMEEAAVERTGDLEVDAARLTARHVEILEEMIRGAPEQYFWHHKRWKTRPPDEAPGALRAVRAGRPYRRNAAAPLPDDDEPPEGASPQERTGPRTV